VAYLAPGVYIKEVDTGSRPIESVGTSVAAFLGRAPDPKAKLREAFPVNNFEEFKRIYCAGSAQTGADSTDLAQAVQLFFLNGGSRCYIVNVADGGIAGANGVDLLRAEDEVAIVAAPGYADKISWDALIVHCKTDTGDRFCILDPPKGLTDVRALTKPASATLPEAPAAEPARGGARRASEATPEAQGVPGSTFSAVYYPCLIAPNIFDGTRYVVPPSGALAGLYARTDTVRGVHKAPANLGIDGIAGLERRVTKQEQELLNPEGVNVIRQFDRLGIRVWGARTTTKDELQWKYVPVRRFFLMVEKSIERATQGLVFEPNDATLWAKIRRDCGYYLMGLWRDGALVGATPEQAFFVRCDESLNPAEVRDLGQVIIEIGLAVVKPAEFVIFRIGQFAPASRIES
jgi:uncharacterized protein